MSSPSLLDKIERVPVSSLKLFPGNARKGDLAAIAESLKENGQVAPLVVQRSTSHVLGGNNTLQAARDLLGWEHIDIVYVDVDDQRASKINAALNATHDRGEYDDTALLAQLAGLDDLAGSGYGEQDLDELRRITGVLGDSATGFLDPFTNPQNPWSPPPSGADGNAGDQDHLNPGTGAPPPPPAPGSEWVQLAWTVTPAHRETIRAAISLAQKRANLTTTAEGLLEIAGHYITSHTETKEPASS